MSLSRMTEARFAELGRYQELYRGADKSIRQLGNRVLVMVIGPAAIGKTHVMQRVAEHDGRFGLASSITSRQPRPDDLPGQFRYYEQTDEGIGRLIDKALKGQLVSYSIHPTELTLYGNEPQDFPYEMNMLATLSGSVDRLASAGFGTSRVIGLTAPPTDWTERFNARYKPDDPQRLKRLIEAEVSYSNLFDRLGDVSWVINRHGHADEAATDLIHAVEGKESDSDEAVAYAQRILKLVEIAKHHTEAEQHE